MHAFLYMGGYGFYVWSAYAVFFVVLLADFLAPILRRRRILREIHARAQRQKTRQARKSERNTISSTDDSWHPRQAKQ